ncbi:uncharacterized protein LOC121729593 [Aricia agestis]|uniref:uncharacterized protein LOC121729593 n=1 Tax=Aricia agestis TaxID=91739 RepID=UPI001C207CA6|nr:uncharacterized protein LOC121729593 [Aricia agestis]
MSYDCGKALRGWCRSFTKTERWLTVLEAIFLVVFISFLTYLILHLLVCSCMVDNTEIHEASTGAEYVTAGDFATTHRIEVATSEENTDGRSCSWTPSYKTEAANRHFLDGRGELQTPAFKLLSKTKLNHLLSYDAPDEADIETVETGLVLALVRVQPLTFGCILSVVSECWTITTASCYDSIKISRHREQFVMIGDRGDLKSGHNVLEVKMHPKYRSNSTYYDLCALKSNTSLGKEKFLILPTPIDYLLTVIGDRLTAFGYRTNRSAVTLHATVVRSLSARRCSLAMGGAVCAGRRGGACGAGSPLLRGRTLLAVLAGRGSGGFRANDGHRDRETAASERDGAIHFSVPR